MTNFQAILKAAECFYLLDHYYKHNLINSDSTASIATCWIAIQSYEMSHPTSLEICNAIHYLCNGGTQRFTTLDPQPRWYRGKRDRWLYGLRKQYQPTTTQQLSIVTRNSCVPQIQMDREYDRLIETQSSSQSSSLVQPQSPPWLFNKSMEVLMSSQTAHWPRTSVGPRRPLRFKNQWRGQRC